MIAAILITGFIFISVGFILNKNNASQLLSGYNTMSKEKQAKFDLEGFIPYFKNFHFYLGISFIILAFLIMFLLSKKASAIFILIYPLLAYGYFLLKSRRFNSKGTS